MDTYYIEGNNVVITDQESYIDVDESINGALYNIAQIEEYYINEDHTTIFHLAIKYYLDEGIPVVYINNSKWW